jgi:TetR/AcrR family transcriptional regulator, repressor for uid operon
MSVPLPAPNEQRRSELRRAQILAAAADCFRNHGFHGASISQISKAAGMSAGHIYHYFEGKEAIIAAIVEQDLTRVLTLTAELRSARDVQNAMIARVAEGVAEQMDLKAAALRLEIVAEAARNPGIAELVRSADRRSLKGLAGAIRSARLAAGHADSELDTEALAEVVAAMFEGLQIRAVRNPDLDGGRVTALYRHLLQDLLTA